MNNGMFYEHLSCISSQVALVVKNPPANAGDIRDAGSILGWGRSPAGDHGKPLQYPCLENPMDRGDWWGYSPWGRKESDPTEVTQHEHTSSDPTYTSSKI